MKALLLLAFVAIAAPAASFADPYCHPHGYRGCGPYFPSYGWYAPAPVVTFSYVSRPRVYSASRYYVQSDSSIEADVQRALRRRGYYTGAVDGDLGPRSRAAIRGYQAEHGMEITGRVDDRLLRSLGI